MSSETRWKVIYIGRRLSYDDEQMNTYLEGRVYQNENKRTIQMLLCVPSGKG